MHTCKFDCDMSGPEWAYRKMMRAHRMAQDAVFAQLGLKEIGQPVLLFLLRDMRSSGKSITQKELAACMNLSPSTITISMKSLEKRGYVRRTADTNDKRRNCVEITDAGMEIAAKCRDAFDRIDAAMYAGFATDEVEQITSLFNRITANLAALTATETESEGHHKC